MFAFQIGQRHLRQANANFILGELRAVISIKIIKCDRGFYGPQRPDQR